MPANPPTERQYYSQGKGTKSQTGNSYSIHHTIMHESFVQPWPLVLGESRSQSLNPQEKQP